MRRKEITLQPVFVVPVDELRMTVFGRLPHAFTIKQLILLRENIENHFLCEPILISEANEVIAGHGTVFSCAHRGGTTIEATMLPDALWGAL